MSQVQFSHNPLFCIDIIKTYKPDFTPRVAFILGSGLGALADQIENAVAISYSKAAGLPGKYGTWSCGGVSAGPSPGRTGGMYERSRTFLRRSWNDHYD